MALLLVHGPANRPPTLAPQDLTKVMRELATLEKQLPDEQKLEKWSGTVDTPLDKEMRSLMHDARGAAQVLVQNFLPDNLAQFQAGNRDGN